MHISSIVLAPKHLLCWHPHSDHHPFWPGLLKSLLPSLPPSLLVLFPILFPACNISKSDDGSLLLKPSLLLRLWETEPLLSLYLLFTPHSVLQGRTSCSLNVPWSLPSWFLNTWFPRSGLLIIQPLLTIYGSPFTPIFRTEWFALPVGSRSSLY